MAGQVPDKELKPASEMDDSAVSEKQSCCNPLKDAQEDNAITKQHRGWCTIFPFTDFLIFLIFCGFFIGLLVVFGTACSEGNINRIQYGTDWQGNACGDKDAGTEDFKHQYWSNPLYYSSMGSICLDTCPGAPTTATSYSSSYSSTFECELLLIQFWIFECDYY
jgi:hypothetical protein